MPSNILLIVKTAHRRYAVRFDDVMDVKMITGPEAFGTNGIFDRPCHGVELGPLLDPSDHSTMVRRRALIIALRRKYVALLVDYVEDFLEKTSSVPLPAILREQLREPWVTGALVLEEGDVIVQLDLRAIARSVMLNRSTES